MIGAASGTPRRTPSPALRYHVPMDSREPTYRDFARWAAQPLDEVARDCEVRAFHARGPGGQCVNTADSAVRMTHRPSGIAVSSRESRSQFRNRQLCLRKLHAQFVRRAAAPKPRRATKPTRASKERRLADKRHRAQTKARRARVDGE
uniref:peptide chain release factor-like protein n=1 Tax=Gordonibacter sp. An230 TaxID=1965592 RepID=UPI0031452A37